MSGSKVGWYWQRARAMSVTELATRSLDRARQWGELRRRVRPGRPVPLVRLARSPSFRAALPDSIAAEVPDSSVGALVAHADGVLAGRWEVLGVSRSDLTAPDWFHDPVTGRRAPRDRYAFRIDHRAEEKTGNVKQVWELSRHHHLTVLAAAWFLTGDDAYAERVARHLRSWWRDNPNLSGVHWTSGIEVAIRVIAWTWCRRLLDRWEGAGDLFDRNPLAINQLYWHQRYLAVFRSTGSSANNHAIAEAAGHLVGACAFPWFEESERWRASASARLERELERNMFPSGIDRELASDYQGFVAELGLVAAVEADASGCSLGEPTWTRLCRMVDASAAVLDERGRAPRQGDGDDGRALLLDAPDTNRWSSLLGLGAARFGEEPWWPAVEPTVFSTLLGGLGEGRRAIAGRPRCRPAHFDDAGLTLLRTPAGDRPEIWCRCDGGPHGFLSIAAHAHADALSVEVRYGGVDVLADPGTYCYHGAAEWRSYFRSTLGHNTLELAGRDQSASGGPFLWVSHAATRVVGVTSSDDGEVVAWSAEHDGYRDLGPPAIHRRTVTLDRAARRVEVTDRIETAGAHTTRMAFHLGPDVHARLDGACAELEWRDGSATRRATLTLPGELAWSAHRGETEPVLGWYSERFGSKRPTTSLVGSGRCVPGLGTLVTSLQLPRSR